MKSGRLPKVCKIAGIDNGTNKSRKGKKKEERAEECRGSLTEREILLYKWRG